MIRTKTMTGELLLSVTKNCETLFEQTYGKSEETFESKVTNRRQAFHFNPVVEAKEDCMIGLTSVEVYISILNVNTTNIKFKLYKNPDGETVSVSYEKVRNEIERYLDISNITATDL